MSLAPNPFSGPRHSGNPGSSPSGWIAYIIVFLVAVAAVNSIMSDPSFGRSASRQNRDTGPARQMIADPDAVSASEPTLTPEEDASAVSASASDDARTAHRSDPEPIVTSASATEADDLPPSFLLGKTLYEQGDYRAAITALDRSIDESPIAAAYFMRGLAYSESGDLERALASYHQGINLFLENIKDDHYNRQNACDAGYINAQSVLYDTNRILKDHDKAIALSPENPELYFERRAWVSYALHDYEQAIRDYSVAVKLNPEFPWAFEGRGWANCGLGNFEQSVADFSQAIDLGLTHSGMYVRRGNAYYAWERYDEARADYTRAIEQSADCPVCYYNRGLTWAAVAEFGEAIRDYDQAIALDPEYVSAYTSRGTAHYMLSEHEQALADHSRAIELYPNGAHYYYDRSLVYSTLEQYGPALEDINRTIELAPDVAEAYHLRAHVYSMREEYQMAILDVRRYLEIAPPSASRAELEAWLAEAETWVIGR